MILRKAINHTKLSDKIVQITVQYCLINDGGPYHIETSIDIQSKSVDWFLNDRDLRHERVNQCDTN